MFHEYVLYATCYPGVAIYLPQWRDSVIAQTDTDFDVCIGVDSMDPAQVQALLGKEISARFFPAPFGATPAVVRNNAFSVLVQEYEGVIMTDMDDILLPDRVKAAKQLLGSSDLSCCAMLIMTDERLIPQAFFGLGRQDVDLLSHNIFGLGNTAYRSALLRECLPAPPECALMDWLLAIRAWGLGATFAFDRTPQMVYRQHSNSTARVLPPFSPEQILQASRLVLGHYSLVLTEAPARYPHLLDNLEEIMRKTAAFDRLLRADPVVLRRYVDDLNQLPPTHAWWDCVAHPKLESIWRS